MGGNLKTGRVFQFALLFASVALIIAGCSTTASYRHDIDGMRTALSEAKTAGAETRAPEEFASAEVCLDWLTHEATEFNPFADPDAHIRGKCQAAFAALKEKMAVAPAARIPAEAISSHPIPQPETPRT